LKLLAFDGSGIVLTTKWLEVGHFDWPAPREGTMCVTGAQLAMLVEGLPGWSKIVARATKRPQIVA
jgi:transposase